MPRPRCVVDKADFLTCHRFLIEAACNQQINRVPPHISQRSLLAADKIGCYGADYYPIAEIQSVEKLAEVPYSLFEMPLGASLTLQTERNDSLSREYDTTPFQQPDHEPYCHGRRNDRQLPGAKW